MQNLGNVLNGIVIGIAFIAGIFEAFVGDPVNGYTLLLVGAVYAKQLSWGDD